jgi:hypothetical protein
VDKKEETLLHFGLMTYEELAAWKGNGTTANGIKGRPTKFFETLKDYCQFERVKEGGKYIGVDIQWIYGSKKYLGSRRTSPAYHIMLTFLPEFFRAKEEHIGSVAEAARAADEMYEETNISLSTWETQGRNARNKLFGNGLDKKRGSIGTSEYVFCISRGGRARPFTEQENQKCLELLHRYYSRSDSNVKARAVIDSLVIEGELSECAALQKKEALDQQERNSCYESFRKEFNSWLPNGCYVIRGIQCIEFNSGAAYLMEE